MNSAALAIVCLISSFSAAPTSVVAIYSPLSLAACTGDHVAVLHEKGIDVFGAGSNATTRAVVAHSHSAFLDYTKIRASMFRFKSFPLSTRGSCVLLLCTPRYCEFFLIDPRNEGRHIIRVLEQCELSTAFRDAASLALHFSAMQQPRGWRISIFAAFTTTAHIASQSQQFLTKITLFANHATRLVTSKDDQTCEDSAEGNETILKSRNVLSFSANGYSFFVRTFYSRHDSNSALNRWQTRLSIICNDDSTRSLTTRVSVTLTCNSANDLGSTSAQSLLDDHTALAAYFAPASQTLFIAFRKDSWIVLCQFPMAIYHPQRRGPSCTNNGKVWSRDQLHGIPILKSAEARIVEMGFELGAQQKHHFLVFYNTTHPQNFYLAKVLLNPQRGHWTTLEDAVSWKRSISAERSPVLAAYGNTLTYVSARNRVESFMPTGCRIYESCKEVIHAVKSGDNDCVWCTSYDAEEAAAMPLNECHAWRLRTECPPVFDKVAASTYGDVVAVSTGTHLADYKLTSASVCGVPCVITTRESERMECGLTDMGAVNVSRTDCQTLMLETIVDQMTVKTKTQLIWSPLYPRSPGLITSIYVPALIFVVLFAVILLCAITGIFVWCYRRKRCGKPKRKNQLYSPSTADNIDGGLLSASGDTIELVKGLCRYPDLQKIVPLALRIPLAALTFGQEIGSGCFGRVVLGQHEPEPGVLQAVAIKFLQGESGVRLFLAEGLMMKDFVHDNVLNLVGIAFKDDVPLVVTPFMANRDLERFLKEAKTLALQDLLRFAFDIAKGMQYLSELKFVHRDLACRNCMLDNGLCVKIADFGLCRNISKSDQYVVQHAARLPAKWMPLESIENGLFTEKSDVWAYGVTLWEITSYCRTPPYDDLSVAALVRFLKSGERLKKPLSCPAEIYAIMRECWINLPEHRPSFANLCGKLPPAIDAVLNHVTSEVVSGSLPTANAFETNDEYEVPNGISGKGCANGLY